MCWFNDESAIEVLWRTIKGLARDDFQYDELAITTMMIGGGVRQMEEFK